MTLRVSRLPATEAKTGLKKTQIYKLMRQGKFPSCIKLGGGRSVGWLDDELDKWIQQQVEATRKSGK